MSLMTICELFVLACMVGARGCASTVMMLKGLHVIRGLGKAVLNIWLTATILEGLVKLKPPPKHDISISLGMLWMVKWNIPVDCISLGRLSNC